MKTNIIPLTIPLGTRKNMYGLSEATWPSSPCFLTSTVLHSSFLRTRNLKFRKEFNSGIGFGGRLRRNCTHMSEAQRSARNALLYRTGEVSRDIVTVLATNRPSDLDAAITDRVDEILEFPLPALEERTKLMEHYLGKYIFQAGYHQRSWKFFFRGQQAKLTVTGITHEILVVAGQRTEGFSCREIAKSMASLQGAVYGTKDLVLDAALFEKVIDYKVDEHQRRKEIVGEQSQ